MKIEPNLIGNILLFEDMSDEECVAITQLCDWTNYESDRQILYEDDRTTDVFFIVKGAVSAKSFSPSGTEVTYLDLGDGEIFGEFSAIDGEHRSATVMTTAPSLIGRLNSDQFKHILKEYPQLSLKFSMLLVAKIRSLSTRIYEFSALNVRCRLHAELLRMCKPTDDPNTGIIKPAPTHYELATHISTHREAVSRELSKLVNFGILKTKGRTYTVCDLIRLKELVALAEM